MKIQDFLTRHPWDETLDLLCSEPPADLPLNVAAKLIRQHREAQIPSLIPLMLSPVLEGEAPEGRVPEKRDRWGLHSLREPRRTARLFIEQAVRSGKDLRQYDATELMRLRPDDAALGRLLRLLAIAEDSSTAQRKNLAPEWQDVTTTIADFGPVLDPMVADSDRLADGQAIHRLTSELASDLSDRQLTESRALSDFDRLLQWASALAREGRQRISELRAKDKRIPPRR